jgi:hypothetical protein
MWTMQCGALDATALAAFHARQLFQLFGERAARRGRPGQHRPRNLARATNKLGFDGDIACLSDAAAERCRFWVEKYKAYRHLLVQDFYPTDALRRARPDDWDVVLWSAYETAKAW